MSRDEAYQAGKDVMSRLVPLDDRYSVGVVSRAVIDAFLEASGIDPDKAYYEMGGDVAMKPWRGYLHTMIAQGALVEVGKENT